MKETFWRHNNDWWAMAARQLLATGIDGQRLALEVWDEANRRLWCLSHRLQVENVTVDDRADLVQEMLLKLQEPELLTKLTVVDAPAHYLAEIMRNIVRNEYKRQRMARRTAPRYAKRVETSDIDRPDYRAAHKELCARARFVVNHELRADDRKVLWWFYKDELSVAQISGRLGISEVAGLKRLSRARKRLRQAFIE